jgi:DNA-binding transcriptional ArsR family regulator
MIVSRNLRFVATYGTNPWDALGDATRRAILEQLAQGPSAVGDLARALPVSRPAVSQHLRVLKEAGLVVDRAAGTRRLYALHTVGLAALRRDLDRLWTHATHALDTVEAAAERKEGKR